MATCAICDKTILGGQAVATHGTEILHRTCVSVPALQRTKRAQLEAEIQRLTQINEQLRLELAHTQVADRSHSAQLRAEKDREIDRLNVQVRAMREQRDNALAECKELRGAQAALAEQQRLVRTLETGRPSPPVASTPAPPTPEVKAEVKPEDDLGTAQAKRFGLLELD